MIYVRLRRVELEHKTAHILLPYALVRIAKCAATLFFEGVIANSNLTILSGFLSFF